MKQPRGYQLRAIAAASSAYAEGARSVVIVSPTGSGKTFMGGMAVAAHLERLADNRVVWLAHREELIAQAARTLHVDFGLSVSVRGANPNAPVQVESVQTILARNDFPKGSLLVPDECHHFCDSNRCGDIVKARPWRILGLTATPERGDEKPLDPPFERLIVAAQISELQEIWRHDHTSGLVPLKIKWPGKCLASPRIAPIMRGMTEETSEEAMVNFTLRIPAALRARIDEYARNLADAQRINVSAGSAARRLLESALDEADRNRGRKR